MEQATQTKASKTKPVNSPTVGLRLRRETKKRIQMELAKINKKDFGKKVRCDELIRMLLPLLTDAHIKSMQDSSMTNADHLERQFRAYIAKNGQLSKDEFIGKLLMGEHASAKT